MIPLMSRAFIALTILGTLGVAGLSTATESSACPSASDSQLSSSPSLPENVVATNATPVGPGLIHGLASPAHPLVEPVVCTPAPSKAGRHVFLIEAQILEKYLSFLESLTSP
jgi:hypothetical protein